MPADVGHTLPSKTYRLGTSCVRPWASTTELAGSVPISVVPSRCQPVARMNGATTVEVAPAAISDSCARAWWNSTSRREFSDSLYSSLAPAIAVLVGADRVQHDAVGLLRQVLGDDAPHRRVPEPAAHRVLEALAPDLVLGAPGVGAGHRERAAGRLQAPLGAAHEPARGVGLVELERVDELAPRALPGAEVLVEDADDGPERVHHQPLADEARGVRQLRRAAAGAACRRRWRTGSSRRP